MFVTYPSSYVMFKKRDSLVKFTRYESEVRNGSTWDLGYITPFFGSRGFDSLKMWMFIKSLGTQKIEKIVEERHKNALFASKLIEKSKLFSIFNDMDFYRMAFVFYPEKIKNKVSKYLTPEIKKEIKKCIDFYSHKINQELYEEGSLCLDEFKLHDLSDSTNLSANEDRFLVLSITIGNPLYTRKTITKSLNLLFEKSNKYLKHMNRDINKIIKQKYNVNCEFKTYGPAGW